MANRKRGRPASKGELTAEERKAKWQFVLAVETRAEREEILTRERSAIAVKHGLAPDIAERFYQERRDWEYDHGDDG
jgi:chorismate mutase